MQLSDPELLFLFAKWAYFLLHLMSTLQKEQEQQLHLNLIFLLKKLNASYDIILQKSLHAIFSCIFYIIGAFHILGIGLYQNL